MMKNNNFIKLKELYNKYKEIKKDPKKKAGMKLLGYFLFFFVFMLIATITNNMGYDNKNEIKYTTTTVKVEDSYSEKQKRLLEDKYDVQYIINYINKEYKINGTLENNIVNGYLEGLDNIKKVLIKNDGIYEINSGIETNLEVDFNVDYLNLDYILNSIKHSSVIKDETTDIKIYNYNVLLDGISCNIFVKTDDDNIVSLEIKEGINNYILNFDK